ncbi:MAG: sigma-70 family RNA polymerase sigma factor [Verrucomicrobiales bacterium]|nr:sigma-70 family RNA polymerase sigma factor [Verrucomicrobiales bacterium]
METIGLVEREYNDEADARDIAGIANGDRDAFQRVHDRYEGLLYATIFKVLNDHCDAEEVLQEVFFSLWRKANQFHENRGRPVTWLNSMARNRAIDRIRMKQRRAKLRDGFNDEQTVNPQMQTAINGSQAATRRDACRAVRSAILELTPVQREAIELSYFEGLTQKEIARLLGEPLGTVKARIRRGLAKLKDTVETEEE